MIEYTYWLYLKVTIPSAGILNILFTSRGQYIIQDSTLRTKLRLWITDGKRERKNELKRVAIKIASFNMRTWFRGPLLPSRPSLKIKKSKVSRFFLCSVIVLNLQQNRHKTVFLYAPNVHVNITCAPRNYFFARRWGGAVKKQNKSSYSGNCTGQTTESMFAGKLGQIRAWR